MFDLAGYSFASFRTKRALFLKVSRAWISEGDSGEVLFAGGVVVMMTFPEAHVRKKVDPILPEIDWMNGLSFTEAIIVRFLLRRSAAG